MRVGIIGAGSWGLAISVLLSGNGHKVTVWSRGSHPEEFEMLRKEREHKTKLPGVRIPSDVDFTTDWDEVMKDKDMFVISIPSTKVRETAQRMKPYVSDGQIVVNTSKGIEESTLCTLSEVIEEEILQASVVVLCGPSHAEEVGRGLPTTIVAGAKDLKSAEFVQNAFMNETFRVYTSTDVLGIEVGSSLKNVVALASGIADGIGYGDNTKAALITRGIAEITRLGLKMGGKFETFAGLTGIGDLIVTCASMHSRNRRCGILIGQGKTPDEAISEVKMVVEGVYSAKAALLLAKKYDVEMPIVEQVNMILFDGKPVKEAVSDLMTRERKIEIGEQ